MAETRIIWCDLEMTGLETEKCAIIELGMVVTDETLKPIAEFERAIWQPESVLESMEPFVREMHTRNGLLDRVRKAPLGLRAVEKEAMQFVLAHTHMGDGILAGNSIHTDRAFISRYMPGLDRTLHYRMIDVSSIKMLVRAWFPHGPGRTKLEANHTVLADLRASIAELAFYKETYFRLAS